MRKRSTFLAAAIAALAAGALVGAAPSLFARGDPNGGSGGGGNGGTGSSRGNPDPQNGGSGDPVGGTSSSGSSNGKGDKTDAEGPDVKGNGEEQRDIAREVMDRMARSRFRDRRDARNRESLEPRRDGETR